MPALGIVLLANATAFTLPQNATLEGIFGLIATGSAGSLVLRTDAAPTIASAASPILLKMTGGGTNDCFAYVPLGLKLQAGTSLFNSGIDLNLVFS
jgi:hypothetical protein